VAEREDSQCADQGVAPGQTQGGQGHGRPANDHADGEGGDQEPGVRDAHIEVGGHLGQQPGDDELGGAHQERAGCQLFRAFYTDLYVTPGNRRNLARFTFLAPAARRFYPDWDSFADITVAIVRAEAGRNPRDKELHDLVGELCTRSDEFRTRWGAHDVRHHGTGTKHFHHHAVGDLVLAFEGLEMTAAPGLNLTIYTAEPGSPSEERLRLLATWAATQEAASHMEGSATS
jgi:hypothetical protein